MCVRVYVRTSRALTETYFQSQSRAYLIIRIGSKSDMVTQAELYIKNCILIETKLFCVLHHQFTDIFNNTHVIIMFISKKLHVISRVKPS